MSACRLNPLAVMLLLAVGIAVAGCDATLDRGISSNAQAAEIQVLVAARDLPQGTLLKHEHLRWQSWPDGPYPPEGHLLEGQIRLANLYGSALRHHVAAGEPILYGLIVRPREPEFLAIAPRPGYQAYSLPVTGKVTSMEPARAGDQVAVLRRHVRAKDETIITRVNVFLRNVRLLALVRDRPRSAMTAILEVAPKQAEKLDTAMMAQNRGEFALYRGGLGADDSELDCPEPISPPN